MKRTLILLVLTVLVGLAAQLYSDHRDAGRTAQDLARIQSNFTALDGRVSLLLEQIEANEVPLSSLADLWSQEGIGFVIYDHGKATDWTTNVIPFATAYEKRQAPRNGVLHLRSAWYLCRTIADGNHLLVAYALLQTDYGFENQYIQNHWGNRIKGSGSFSISTDKKGNQPLKLTDGTVVAFLFAQENPMPTESAVSLVSWILLLLLVLAFLWSLADLVSKKSTGMLGHWLFAAMAIGLRTMMLLWQFPRALYAMALFDPTLHATSWFIPSLGDLFIHVLLLLVVFVRFAPVMKAKPHRFGVWPGVVIPVLLLWPVYWLLNSLVVNSSFSLDLTDPFSLNIFSFWGLLITFLVGLNYHLLVRWLFRLVPKKDRRGWRAMAPLILAMLLLFVMADTDRLMIPIVLSGGLAVWLLLKIQHWTHGLKGLSRHIPEILTMSILACVMLNSVQWLNEQESRKAIARKLEQQQDPITEYLFAGLEKKILADRNLRNILAASPLEEHASLEALRAPFAYDHWNRYRTVFNLFNDDGGLMASDEERTGPNYFEIQNTYNLAKPTLSPHLGYLGGEMDGGYIARIELPGSRSHSGLVLFVKLLPEKTDDVLGFTDLFVDEGVSTSKQLQGYSYAIYDHGGLIDSRGDFPYSLSSSAFDSISGENRFVNSRGYDHLVHRPVEERLVVVSRKSRGAMGYLTVFSYLFLFYAACGLIVLLFSGGMAKGWMSTRSFRNRINLAMSSVLFVSLLIIGLLTVAYVVKEYHARNREMISEKSRSVVIELKHKLLGSSTLTDADRPMLTTLLTKFSKVFFTDINLYRLDGHLLATSRPRLFDEGLMAKVMEPEAYRQMRFNRQSRFIQEETIGNLSYLTVYVPFRNSRNEVIAFMSLPYFARQYGLQQEIFSLLAALTNIYVFLILISVVLALFISNRITEPLRSIRESLKHLKLDQQNRTIQWESNDEIGQLVDEYNRTLNELVRSAELLARSERESAWREMAKQVAHEIKNPLTPMKLSIQMLLRSMHDGVDDLKPRIEKVSRTLIEQIDTLSNIATEFSSFAKMPKPVVETIDLRKLLENAAELHRNDNVALTLNIEVSGESLILADREQMLRVLNNLIKNGIQAVPESVKVQIALGLIRNGDRWVASVQDNGSGIPEELKERIFAPNFTTKSSGMGLGLAMVKNIVENLNGRIWFISSPTEGTCFYLSFPAV